MHIKFSKFKKLIHPLALCLTMLIVFNPSVSSARSVSLAIVNDIASNISEFSASGFRTMNLFGQSRVFLNSEKQGRIQHRFHWVPKTATFMIGFKTALPKLENHCPLIDYCGHSNTDDVGDISYLCATSYWQVDHNTTIHLHLSPDYQLTCEREISAFQDW